MLRRSVLVAAACLTFACSKPKPPELTPVSVQVAALTPTGVELSLLLDAKNPNSFPLLVSGVSGTFALQDGTELGRGQSASSFSIPGEQHQQLPATLDVTWTGLSALAPYAFAVKPVPYRIHGNAHVGSEHLNVEVPFTIDGQLTPDQVVAAGLKGAGSLLGKH